MTDGVSVGAFDPAAADAEARVRKFVPPSGPTTFAGATLRFSGVPAPTHVLEATSGDTVWTLDGGDLSLGALHAGETRTEVLRITVPPWVPGTKFVLRIEAELEGAFATGKSRNVSGQLGSTYDDDIERIAESRHGDVMAYASALATMHRLTAAFAGDAVDAQGGLLALAKLHSGSLTRPREGLPRPRVRRGRGGAVGAALVGGMSARGAERVADEAAEYLTADDVARILTVSRTTAYKLMRQMGRLVEGRVVRVARTSLRSVDRATQRTPRRGRVERATTDKSRSRSAARS